MAAPSALKLCLPADSSPADPAVEAARSLLQALGEDVEREGLRRTPQRLAKALRFLTSGSQRSSADVLNGAVFNEDCDEMVIVREIEFFSLCEHHLLPFSGRAHVGYLPAGRVLGLSKLPRLLDVYARRLQVQERLTRQLAAAVAQAVEPRGVAVMLEADHFCMMMRGVAKQHARTDTFAFLGEFKRLPERRAEFLQAVRGAAPTGRPTHRPRRSARGPDASEMNGN